MNLLDVYFHNKKIGVLKEHNSRLSFKYSDDATEPRADQVLNNAFNLFIIIWQTRQKMSYIF